MWIKTKAGDYANMAFVSFLWKRHNEWVILENGGDGFCHAIDDETANRLIEKIRKELF